MRRRSRAAALALWVLVPAALAGGGARPAAAQEVPITFMKVAELDGLLRKGVQVHIVDVRSRQEYLARHLPAAISVPLDTIEMRAGEIPRRGLVVLY